MAARSSEHRVRLCWWTREKQNPFDFSRFDGWFAGVEKKTLKLGDYSIATLEDSCVVERKDLSDLVHSLTAERPVFVHRLRLMSAYPQRLLVITAALSTVKSSYAFSEVNPNRIMQSLIAALAGWNLPFVCTETHELGRGDHRLLLVPGPSLPLAGLEWLWPVFGRQ